MAHRTRRRLAACIGRPRSPVERAGARQLCPPVTLPRGLCARHPACCRALERLRRAASEKAPAAGGITSRPPHRRRCPVPTGLLDSTAGLRPIVEGAPLVAGAGRPRNPGRPGARAPDEGEPCRASKPGPCRHAASRDPPGSAAPRRPVIPTWVETAPRTHVGLAPTALPVALAPALPYPVGRSPARRIHVALAPAAVPCRSGPGSPYHVALAPAAGRAPTRRIHVALAPVAVPCRSAGAGSPYSTSH